MNSATPLLLSLDICDLTRYFVFRSDERVEVWPILDDLDAAVIKLGVRCLAVGHACVRRAVV